MLNVVVWCGYLQKKQKMEKIIVIMVFTFKLYVKKQNQTNLQHESNIPHYYMQRIMPNNILYKGHVFKLD